MFPWPWTTAYKTDSFRFMVGYLKNNDLKCKHIFNIYSLTSS